MALRNGVQPPRNRQLGLEHRHPRRRPPLKLLHNRSVRRSSRRRRLESLQWVGGRRCRKSHGHTEQRQKTVLQTPVGAGALAAQSRLAEKRPLLRPVLPADRFRDVGFFVQCIRTTSVPDLGRRIFLNALGRNPAPPVHSPSTPTYLRSTHDGGKRELLVPVPRCAERIDKGEKQG